MTQKERIEVVEKELIMLKNTVSSLDMAFEMLQREWRIYEDSYKKYVNKKTRVKRFLAWFYYKVTFKTRPKLTRAQLIRCTANKMAGIFHE